MNAEAALYAIGKQVSVPSSREYQIVPDGTSSEGVRNPSDWSRSSQFTRGRTTNFRFYINESAFR